MLIRFDLIGENYFFTENSNTDDGYRSWTFDPLVVGTDLKTIELSAWGSPSDLFSYRIEINTVTAVPEPSTYALMLAGLAAVGFTARRRRAVPLRS